VKNRVKTFLNWRRQKGLWKFKKMTPVPGGHKKETKLTIYTQKETFSIYGWHAYEEIWTGVHYHRSHLKTITKSNKHCRNKNKIDKKTSRDTRGQCILFSVDFTPPPPKKPPPRQC
jgi:hypothetical protein